MQCTNQLKQIGLAIHNFHDTKNRFPNLSWQQDECIGIAKSLGIADPSTIGDKRSKTSEGGLGIRHDVGYLVPLLPFIEQQAAYDDINTGLRDPESEYWPGGSRFGSNRLNPNIGMLLCPSDSARWTNEQTTKTSYRACGGDLGCEVESDTWPAAFIRGAFVPGRYEVTTSMASISDGTSNTIFASESCIGDGSRRVKTATPDGNLLSSDHGPIACLTYVADKNYLSTFSVVPADNWRFLKGGRGLFSEPEYSVFFTMAPPNAPWCRNDWGLRYISASSNHTGGVNCVLGDASVRFVSETVNCSTPGTTGQAQSPYSAPINSFPWGNGGPYGGASPYGVWGAYGSKSGGESSTL